MHLWLYTFIQRLTRGKGESRSGRAARNYVRRYLIISIIFLCQWSPQLRVQIGADICLDISLIHKTVRPASEVRQLPGFDFHSFAIECAHSLSRSRSHSFSLSLVVVLINCRDSARVCKYWNIRLTSVGPRPVIEKFDSCQVENIFRLSTLIYLLIHQIPNLAQRHCHSHSHSQSRSPNQLAIVAQSRNNAGKRSSCATL